MRAFIRWTSALLLLACAVAAVAVWQLKARDALTAWDPDKARGSDRPIPVRTVKVDERDVVETIGGTAVTMPAQTATISIPMSSSEVTDREVKEVKCWFGCAVKQGDVLVAFEPALFEQMVQQRQALVGQTKEELQAYRNLQRQKAASAMQVKEAQVAVETAELQLALANRDLQLCQITSPINGVVDQLNVVPQMRIGGGGVLAVIHQLDPIYVQMDYPMERLDSLKLGQTAEVALDAYAQESFTGKVIRIAPVVSTKTRVLPVMLEVPNPDNRIKAGISGFVRITSSRPGATTIPSVALIKKQRKAMVVCVEDNRARLREVQTGNFTEAGEIEILGGLGKGDEVVVYGQDAIEEDDLVNVDWKKWTRREYPIP
jgi:RND family efflux transporter MFP subunit